MDKGWDGCSALESGGGRREALRSAGSKIENDLELGGEGRPGQVVVDWWGSLSAGGVCQMPDGKGDAGAGTRPAPEEAACLQKHLEG